MFEGVIQNWRGILLGGLTRIVLEICSETESVVYFFPDDLISKGICCVEGTIELDEMIRLFRIGWGLLRIRDPDNVFLALDVRGYVFKGCSCIKTEHVIEISSAGIITDHIPGCMTGWITIASPHVKFLTIDGLGENSSKKVLATSPVNCAFKDINILIDIDNTIIILLSYQGIKICLCCISMNITKFWFSPILFISLKLFSGCSSYHVVYLRLIEVVLL